jgi:hypothetical protein
MDASIFRDGHIKKNALEKPFIGVVDLVNRPPLKILLSKAIFVLVGSV